MQGSERHGDAHTIFSLLARGMFAGLVGTAAMTAVQLVEMRRSGREPSKVPAQAVEKLLNIEVHGDKNQERLSNLTHWAYGTSWGVVRALFDQMGLRGFKANSLHLAAVWGAAAAMLPRLGLAPPVRKWSRSTVQNDLMHHAVYSFAAGAAFDWASRRKARRESLGPAESRRLFGG